MSQFKKVLIASGILAASIFGAYQVGHQSAGTGSKVLYSLDAKKNDQAVIDVISSADKYVYFAVYTFTKDNIADALVGAKKRGLTVAGITDLIQSQQDFEKPIIQKLTDAGISVETQTHPDGIMHIKAVVTDKAYASGSFNWTSSATVANDEVLEIGTDKNLHDQYLSIIQKVLAANEGQPTTAAASANETETDAPATTGAGKIYNYTEANSHIGETASVTGHIAQVYTSKSGTTFFDYCSNYKSCGFSAVIFSSDKSKFSNLSQYQGKDLTITGKITSYQGQAEIVLSSPEQILK